MQIEADSKQYVISKCIEYQKNCALKKTVVNKRDPGLVAGKGEVLNKVRMCLFEKVTFEGGEGTTCVKQPYDG